MVELFESISPACLLPETEEDSTRMAQSIAA
jgi:hypothetical protein